MTPIEEKSIKTQIELMNDIINNDNTIMYSIERRGKELLDILSTLVSDNNDNFLINRETYQKLLDIAYILKSEENWSKLTSISENAIINNKIKKEILKKLK